MAALTIERLHARYHDVAVADVARLDRALALLTDALDEAVDGDFVRDAYAICIPELSVVVEIAHDGGVSSITQRWARALFDAIEDAVHHGRVVVYPRELDAVIDLCRSVATGDRRRLWAWRQVGLVSGAAEVGSATVDAVVIGRPTLLPALLGALHAQSRLPLSDAGWHRCALAFVELRAARGKRHSISAVLSSHRSGSSRRRAAAIATRVLDVIPVSALERADTATRHALVTLAIAAIEPTSLSDLELIEAVAAELQGSVGEPHRSAGHDRTADRAPNPPSGEDDDAADEVPAGSPSTERDPETAGGDEAVGISRRRVDDHGADAPPEAVDLPDDAEVAPSPADLERSEIHASAYGGVWYLATAIEQLDVAGRLSAVVGGLDAAIEPTIDEALRLTIAEATGVADDDPAVIALAAGDVDQPAVIDAPVDADLRTTISAQAAALRTWLAERLRLGADADVGWVWRRAATMEIEPGWIEVTFLLDDVDLRLRQAGIDLDPGYLWWRGAVVRFRHV